MASPVSTPAQDPFVLSDRQEAIEEDMRWTAFRCHGHCCDVRVTAIQAGALYGVCWRCGWRPCVGEQGSLLGFALVIFFSVIFLLFGVLKVTTFSSSTGNRADWGRGTFAAGTQSGKVS